MLERDINIDFSAIVAAHQLHRAQLSCCANLNNVNAKEAVHNAVPVYTAARFTRWLLRKCIDYSKETNTHSQRSGHHASCLSIERILQELVALFRRQHIGRDGQAHGGKEGNGGTNGAQIPRIIETPSGNRKLVVVIEQIRLRCLSAWLSVTGLQQQYVPRWR